MRRLRVFVLYEHLKNRIPCVTSHVRLLRPLSHPSVAGRVELRAGRVLEPGSYDAVIVERNWRPGLTHAQVDELHEAVRASGAKLIHSLDDNLFDHPELPLRRPWAPTEDLEVLERLSREAHGVLVSTAPLRERIRGFNGNSQVVPNALDERLIVYRPPAVPPPFRREQVRIGYMGTRSHDEDLRLIAPALRAAYARHGDRLAIEMIGVVKHGLKQAGLGGVPVRFISTAEDLEYPRFMLEFTGHVRWDIAVAPLVESPFTACKSDLKVLDYAAIGAAGMFSRVTPYEEASRRGIGHPVSNSADAWTGALEQLIEDGELRTRVAATSWRYLEEERTLRVCAGQWVDALEELVA